jgi:Ala-tRNA(Pro) deacylase
MDAHEIVIGALNRAGAAFELLRHERTESATAEAAELGVPAEAVAKTLVVRTPEGYVRAVLSGARRIDIHKVREIVGGGKRTSLATEEDLARDYPEFEVGAVPPFGGRRDDPVLIDPRLLTQDAVVIEAGRHDESIRVPTPTLMALVRGAQVVDISAEEPG